MSLLGAMLNKAPTTKTPVPLVGRSQGGLFGSLLRMPAAAQQLSAMEAIGTVFGIVDRIATSVSLVEWQLFRKAKSGKKEDREEITSHLALDIWNKPNDFYCLAPETRVVTADLEWIPVGDLQVGDKLLGFEEKQVPGKRRQWKSTEVTGTGRKMLPCYRVTFEDGTQVVASEDHRWLAQTPINGDYWRKTKDLLGKRPGGNRRGGARIQKLLEVWDAPQTYSAGYLSGVYDGEGSLYTPSRQHSMGLNVAQRDNEVLAELETRLPEFGFRVKRQAHATGVEYLHMLGGAPEILRFLGTIRPQRLLAKWRKFGADALGAVQRLDNVAVTGLEYLGLCEVVALGTSTETYIAEGFGTHNTRQELVETEQQHKELTGEGWLVVGRDERARSIPLELWPVRPDRMEPLPSATAYLLGYMYRSPDGEQVPLERQDVLFMRRPDPQNPYRGLGPIKPILTDIDSVRYAAEWNRNFFLNSAEPGGIVEVEKRLSDDEFDEMTARWAEQHKGVSRAHNVAILEQAKWVDRKYSMRDMQFTELRGVTSAAIREAFGFPKFMTGDVTDVNRANADASEAMFAKWLIVPRLERWKQMLNTEFLPLFGATAEDLEFDYISPVPENSEAENAARTSKSGAVATLVPLGFDPVDAMEKFGLPAIKWSKPEPVAPPMGGFGDKGKPPADPLMALWSGQLLGHRPGGKDHDQRSHGRTRARLAKADERLMADRLGWKSVGWGMTPEQRLADARQTAQGDDVEAIQARGSLLQARYDLERDRASVLARVEAVAFINEWIDDHPSGMRGTFEVERRNRKVVDDPRLEALGEALDSGDRTRILRSLRKTAEDAGITRIGGDPRRGPDQLLAFDPRTHQSIGGLIRPGQKAILVRPGYSTKDDNGETVVLERAVVEEAYPEDIARIQGSGVPRLRAQAPTDDPELALVQADWEAGLERLLAQWRDVTTTQRAEIRNQVRTAVENGDMQALADIELPHEEAAAVLLAALIALAAIAGGRMATELATAGAPQVAPADLSTQALAPIATAAAVLLAGRLAAAAASAAVSAYRIAASGVPATEPREVGAAVDAALDGLSDRALRDQLGGALTTAQNMARLQTGREVEETIEALGADLRITYIATEKLDANTCFQCLNIDGTEYDAWIDAWIDYAGGKYRGCEGRNRCRGTIKARVEEVGNGGQEQTPPPEPDDDDPLQQLLAPEDDEPQRVRVGVGR